jgi:hypothetical protein
MQQCHARMLVLLSPRLLGKLPNRTAHRATEPVHHSAVENARAQWQ